MKSIKRLWSALLAVVLLFGTLAGPLATPVSAAGGKTNVNKFEFSETELKPGDTFTVTFATAAMKVQVFTLAMDFDSSLFEVTKVNTTSPYLQYMGMVYDEDLEEEVEGTKNFDCTAFSTVDQMNDTGHMGMSFVHTEDREYLARKTLVRLTFKVRDGASGTTTMSFYESSAGTDQCLDTKEKPSGTQTLTIKGSEPEHTCTLVEKSGKAATCGEAGWKNYYQCSDETCGKLYEDAEGKTEIPNLEAWKTDAGKINATGEHSYTPGAYTWTGVESCSVVGTCTCGAEATATTTNITSKVTTKANCQTEEVTTYTATFTESWAKTNTKEVKGAKDENNHPETATREENVVGATCETAKTYDEVTFCTQCGATISTKVGLTSGTSLGHKWGDPTYHWSADNTSCTATRVCTTDEKHTETVTSTEVKTKVIEGATCGAAGQTKFTAIFAKDWASTEKTENVPGATGNHTYTLDTSEGTNGYAWAEDYSTCTAYGKCSCGAKTTAIVETTRAVTTKGNCQTAEVVTYTAAFEVNWAETQNKSITGEKDEDNHASDEVVYKNNTGDTHDEYHMCCDTLIQEKVSHTYEGGVCACEKVQTFTVTWKINGETVETETVEYGKNATKNPTIPAKEGYDAAWDKTATNVTSDVIITAVYTVKAYKITWELDGGTAGGTYPTSANYGTSVGVPKIYSPTKTGYTFTGWVDQDDNAVELNSSNYYAFTMPAKDVTLTAQWTVNTYTITWIIDGVETTTNVEYGTLPTAPVATKAADDNFTYDFKAWDKEVVTATEDETYTAIFARTGWDNKQYLVRDEVQKTGWTEIDGAWYYLNPTTGIRAEGLTRVPYPTGEVAGNTYKPNAADVAYYESKGKTFIDKEEGWFLFGEDGKFQSTTTGKGTYNGATRWIENGHIAWHPGMVKIDGEHYSDYYYFLGDVEKGGNILATKAEGATKNELGEYDITVTRANHSSLDREFNSGIYTFYTSGELATLYGMCNYGEYDSITGKFTKIRLYGMDGADKHRLMCGLGLYNTGSERDPEYIYVRSNGECVKNQSYWVSANDYGIPEGMYEFDEKGHMIIPEVTEKNGIYSEDGAWVYYENGSIGYNKGLIHFEGTWYDADGKIAKTEDAWIYVRSNGALATGKYYVTTVSAGAPLAAGDKGTFDEYGIMQNVKNGIVDGKYYINDKVQYNAGVVKLENGKYIYVRSNGEVVMGKDYWITNVGDSGVVAKKYTFDADGYFTPDFAAALDKNIVNGYYYEDGKIAYAAGVVEYGGGYIYVRSNGQVATGKYWATNTNGILDAKMYDWGTDGIYIPE